MKIGFFDSGLGGLTVMKAVVKHLPQYDYEFYGDTANLPYGDKTEEEIFELTKVGMQHLFERGCALVIIACNTASAETLRKLQDTFLPEAYPERKILGVIIPMVETVCEAGERHTLLLATARTISSKKYEKEFAKQVVKRPELISVATPELVPLIESGDVCAATEKAIEHISNAFAEGIDSVILGCTHYGLLRDGIEKHFGASVAVYSADQIIPQKVEGYLAVHHEIKVLLTQGGTRNIYLTRHTPSYDKLMGDLLGGFVLPE
jgi:glutamate racemase